MYDDIFSIHWHITNKCNLRCRHCYQDIFTDEFDLSFEYLKMIADNFISGLKELNKKAIVLLTGGEPILKKELPQIIEYLQMYEEITDINIITNATVYRPEIWYNRFIKEIIISLDGSNEDINDFIRGHGVYKRVINNIQSYGDGKIVIIYTLMKYNLMDALSMLDLVRFLNINGVIYERFIPLGRGKNIKDQILTKEDWIFFVRNLSNLFSLDMNELLKNTAFRIKINGGNYELKGATCIVGRGGFCIMPEGTILPCRRFYYPLGNLLNQDFIEIWNNSPILKILRDRNNLKGKCKICNITDCTGCRAMVYSLTGDYLMEDITCWKE